MYHRSLEFTMPHAVDTDIYAHDNVIAKSFFESRTQWFDEPVLNAWATSPSVPKVLKQVNGLYHQWRKQPQGPFSPSSDPLWAETAKVQRDAGLPWHNNNLNLPEDVDKVGHSTSRILNDVLCSQKARVWTTTTLLDTYATGQRQTSMESVPSSRSLDARCHKNNHCL